MGPEDEDRPVTLGDLIDDPKRSLHRMAAIVKRDLTNPKVMIPLVVGAGVAGLARASDYSPSMPNMPSLANVRGGVGRTMRTAAEAVDPDLVSIVSPRAGAVLRKMGKVADVLQPKPVPSPAEVAPPSVPTAATPPTAVVEAPATTPTEPVVARPAPKPKAAPQRAAPKPKAADPSPDAAPGDLPSLDDLHLTPAEITQGVKWHEQGVNPETILHRILQSRQLTARTRTETPDQAAAAVRYRNEKGRWQDEK